MKAIALLTPLLVTGMNAAHAQANLLVNPSFELPALTAASTCDGGTPWCLKGTGNTPGWMAGGSGVTVIHNNYLAGVNPPILVSASDGVQYLNLSQVGTFAGDISQTVAATAGQQYRLSLDASAWAINAIGASVSYALYDPGTGDLLGSGSFTAALGNGAWTTNTLLGTAASDSIRVVIATILVPQAAIGIDNVVLSAVPEPQSCAMLLAGLAATVATARRKRT